MHSDWERETAEQLTRSYQTKTLATMKEVNANVKEKSIWATVTLRRQTEDMLDTN